MKVENVEKFRGKLFNEIEEIFYIHYDVEQLHKVEFRDSIINPFGVLELENTISLRKYDKIGNIDTLYITLDYNSLMIWKSVIDGKNSYFKMISVEFYDDYKNKSLFMLNLGVTIQKFLG